jgi:hypothetical protein
MPDTQAEQFADLVRLREAARAMSKAADDLEREVRSRATEVVTLGEVRAIQAALLHVEEVGQRLKESLS